MNAARALLAMLSPLEQRELMRRRLSRFDPPAVHSDTRAALDAAGDRWDTDLVALLNHCRRPLLETMAAAIGLDGATGPSARSTGQLRTSLWLWGARQEAGGEEHIGSQLQPLPHRIGERLVIHAPPAGAFPPSDTWPRPIPHEQEPPEVSGEPDNIDELLAAATRLIGVRLGERGRDKGAWGQRVATLLGLVETGDTEPDWRGDVEVKTVPVRCHDGLWRVSEDPAISMVGATPVAKLQRVLWVVVAPVSGPGAATVLSWYFQPWDDEVGRWARRYLHERPKGSAGSVTRGLYLSKRYFAVSGLLFTLNGPPAS